LRERERAVICHPSLLVSFFFSLRDATSIIIIIFVFDRCEQREEARERERERKGERKKGPMSIYALS
jgi:hypothetical protein